MAARGRLTQKQTQVLSLTPTVRLSLSVLQMNALELEIALAAEAEENPFLISPPSRGSSAAQYDFDPETIAAPEDIGGKLRAQIGSMGLSPAVLGAARAISWSLDNRGYLASPLTEIAELAGVDLEAAKLGLDAIQTCDPPGIGARDGSECLSIQLAERGIDKAEARMAIAHLELLTEGKLARVARHSGLSIDLLQHIFELLPELTLDPAAGTHPEPASRVPDLEFARDDTGQVEALFLHDHAADQAFDRALLASMPQNGPARELARRAQSLLAAIEHRRETILRIGNALAERQAGFFAHGARSLHPLTRRELAEELRLAPSTISRAVSDKSFLYQGQVQALSALFASGIKQPSGAHLSAMSISSRIAEIIASDPERANLSDAEVTRRLQKEGVDIARRTVAKYRQCLNIPSSFQRQRIHRAKQRGMQSRSRSAATDD